MGLGPPVCKKCRVYANYSKEKGYFCDFCNEPQQELGHMWSMGISNDELDGNYRFYKFFKDGKE